MIGDRIGYMIGNQKEQVQDISIILGYKFASAPYLPQRAFNSVYEHQEEIEEYIQNMITLYKEKAEFLIQGLQDIGFEPIPIEGGMFSMTEIKKLTGMDGN